MEITFSMFVNSGTPFFNPGLDPGVLSEFVSAAQSYSQNVIGLTIPSTLSGSMQTYITNQLQSAITNGGSDLVASGGQSDAFSVAQLVMDLAAFAAEEAGGSASAGLENRSPEKASATISSSQGSLHQPRPLNN